METHQTSLNFSILTWPEPTALEHKPKPRVCMESCIVTIILHSPLCYSFTVLERDELQAFELYVVLRTIAWRPHSALCSAEALLQIGKTWKAGGVMQVRPFIGYRWEAGSWGSCSCCVLEQPQLFSLYARVISSHFLSMHPAHHTMVKTILTLLDGEIAKIDLGSPSVEAFLSDGVASWHILLGQDTYWIL